MMQLVPDGRVEQAQHDYFAMGPTRSLVGLAAHYRSLVGSHHPPTRRVPTLKQWSALYKWQEKAAAYDAMMLRLQATADLEDALADARIRRKRRLETAAAVREKADAAVELLNPITLVRRPSDLARLISLVSSEERNDAPVEPHTIPGQTGPLRIAEDHLTAAIQERTVIILPANGRDKLAVDE